ncbi:imidazole glycerol phosphate synthase subunit HisH [Candidatus Bathyarchaeota archaeon]|nr:imidazole glycerol phosphate synthase subunit HisH [Candidatus Bathyarchaeota archaeon]
MIVVIDYKMGNIGSIINMIKKAGGEVKFSSELDQIENAEKLILPGVGSFDAGMQNLTKLGLIGILRKKVLKDKIPILGVCLGMQLFMERSEEGILPGLGFINGSTVKFKFDEKNANLRIPHMGWDSVEVRKESPLFSSMYENPVFYFVHSYHVVCNNVEDVLSTTNYGYDFVSSLQRKNIFGTQFHPEKSHKYGLKMLQNFIELAFRC